MRCMSLHEQQKHDAQKARCMMNYANGNTKSHTGKGFKILNLVKMIIFSAHFIIYHTEKNIKQVV